METGYRLPVLPPDVPIESTRILRKLASAHRYLAELKGVSQAIPKQEILINTLALQEAKDSSAIENIITTHDDLYKEELGDHVPNAAAKEVRAYAGAVRLGYDLVTTTGLLTVNHIVAIYQAVKRTEAGIRKVPGTELRNDQTGETIYIPPQDHATIVHLLANLERYINDDAVSSVDPLVKMAVMHYQFESIHPFTDGNGRTGRIMNVLYLVLKGLLDIPVLYLSRYIIQQKADYYRLLQEIREGQTWEDWVWYMLDGVEQTSRQTITLIQGIGRIMLDYTHRIRALSPKMYSQDLLNNLFFHPYTKIEFIVTELSLSRPTAAKYLDELARAGLLRKERLGKSNYYVNTALCALLSNIPPFAAHGT